MRVASIPLHVPSEWIAPINPAHAAAERIAESWLRSIGLLGEREGFASIAQSISSVPSIALVAPAGLIFPFAPSRALSIAARWLGFASLSVKAPVAPLLLGVTELGRSLREMMSARWLNQHAERIEVWLRSVQSHAAFLACEEERRGAPPSLAEYLAVRGLSVGVMPLLDLLEVMSGRELPPAVSADPLVLRAERLACKIVALQADLVSVSADRAASRPNAVTCEQDREETSIVPAALRLARFHDEHVVALTDLRAALLTHHGDVIRPWLDDLSAMIGGFSRYHLASVSSVNVHAIGRDVIELKLEALGVRDVVRPPSSGSRRAPLASVPPPSSN